MFPSVKLHFHMALPSGEQRSTVTETDRRRLLEAKDAVPSPGFTGRPVRPPQTQGGQVQVGRCAQWRCARLAHGRPKFHSSTTRNEEAQSAGPSANPECQEVTGRASSACASHKCRDVLCGASETM